MAHANYYLDRKSALLKKHDKLIQLGQALMIECYGEAQTQVFINEAREAFIALLPEIPYIGGQANSLTDTLEQMTSLLALYRVMTKYGRPVDEIGPLVHEMALIWANQYPAFARQMIGRLYMSRFWRQRTRRKAVMTQQREHVGNFVFEVVEGDGNSFEWGINYLECGVVKFFHTQGADEFTPYMCLIDFLIFPAMGVQLERTGTIANGCTHCDFRFKKR